jgi:excisionase family DNA binding protein
MSKNVNIFLDKFINFFIMKHTYSNYQVGFIGGLMVNGGLMTMEDLSKYLKVTRRTIYDWLKHNKIPAVKLVGQWRFKRDKIDAWIDSGVH